jgi:hypothetical protein
MQDVSSIKQEQNAIKRRTEENNCCGNYHYCIINAKAINSGEG